MRLHWIAIGALLLVNCTDEPRLQTGSEKLFRKSMERIMKSASPDQFAAFDRALQEIALARLGAIRSTTGTLLHLPMTDVVTAALIRQIETDWPEVQATVVRRDIAAVVDGRLPDEVIRLVDQEKRDAIERARHRLQGKLAQSRQELAEVMTWAAEPPTIVNNEIIDAVKISSTSFYFRSTESGEEPMVSFLIASTMGTPITKIFVSIALQASNETANLVREVRELSFHNGLNAGNGRRISFVFGAAADFQKVSRERLARSNLTVTPIFLEDIQGGKLGAIDPRVASNRERELRQLVDELDRELAELATLN